MVGETSSKPLPSTPSHPLKVNNFFGLSIKNPAKNIPILREAIKNYKKCEKVIFAFITPNDFFTTILQDDGFVPNFIKGAHAL